MEGISRKDLDLTCTLLEKEGMSPLAKKIKDFDFIPKMYAYTYLKRFYQEIKDVKTTQLEELFIEGPLDALKLDIVTPANLTGLKELLRIAFAREKFICDFDDSHNPSKKFGKCESEEHYGEKEDEELSIILFTDESNLKYDDYTAEYYCKSCSDNLDGADDEYRTTCDMEIGDPDI